MGWKDTFTFLSPTFVTHKVQDQELHFYPISVKFIFELKTLGKALAQALAALFSNKDSDTGATTKSTKEKDREATETVVDPITPEIAILRTNQKQEAFEAIFEAASNQDNGMLIGRMLMDSLRENFTPEERENRNQALEFIKAMDLATFKDMLLGLVKANAKVLGPLENMAAQLTKSFLSGLPTKEDEKPVATLVPKEEAEPEITGQTSEIPSANSLFGDSLGT